MVAARQREVAERRGSSAFRDSLFRCASAKPAMSPMASTDGLAGEGDLVLYSLDFQQLMLSPANSAICPEATGRDEFDVPQDEFDLPMCDYWGALPVSRRAPRPCSCLAASLRSHACLTRCAAPRCPTLILRVRARAAYAEADQLAGPSSDGMYRRLLLQGCRSIEIDCWDGDDGEPMVTHGRTLCTRVKFELVVQAIADTAFVTSPLPVSISLEVSAPRRGLFLRNRTAPSADLNRFRPSAQLLVAGALLARPAEADRAHDRP
eukprot:4140676-Prymnesium_polylepis.1